MNKKHFILAIAIILIDQIVKILMIGRSLTIIPGFLDFTYTQNMGAAFGMGKPVIVLIVNILLVLGIIIVMTKYKNKITNFIPYIMVLAGGIGNLIDRVFRGFVIDFIDVNLFDFPVFNIADICIVLGIFIICYTIIRDEIKHSKK